MSKLKLFKYCQKHLLPRIVAYIEPKEELLTLPDNFGLLHCLQVPKNYHGSFEDPNYVKYPIMALPQFYAMMETCIDFNWSISFISKSLQTIN